MKICKTTRKQIKSPKDCWNDGEPCYCSECSAFMDLWSTIEEPTKEDIELAHEILRNMEQQ